MNHDEWRSLIFEIRKTQVPFLYSRSDALWRVIVGWGEKNERRQGNCSSRGKNRRFEVVKDVVEDRVSLGIKVIWVVEMGCRVVVGDVDVMVEKGSWMRDSRSNVV